MIKPGTLADACHVELARYELIKCHVELARYELILKCHVELARGRLAAGLWPGEADR